MVRELVQSAVDEALAGAVLVVLGDATAHVPTHTHTHMH